MAPENPETPVGAPKKALDAPQGQNAPIQQQPVANQPLSGFSGEVPQHTGTTANIPYTNLEQFLRDLGIKPPKKHTGGAHLRVLAIVLLFLIGIVLMIVGFGLFAAVEYPIAPIVFVLLILCPTIGGSLLMFLSYKVFFKGRRKEQTLKLFNELGDTRRPIIYLRSFADDNPGITIRRYLKGMVVPFYFSSVLFSDEEALSTALQQFGPVLAIGQPGENLPDVGAARLYTDPQGVKWQQDVAQMLAVCQLVVLRAGITTGLQWEIREVFPKMPPEKVLLYVDLSKKKYRKFVQNFQNWTGIQLPEPNAIKGSSPFFLYFYQGFQYAISTIKSPLSKRRLFHANTAPFLYGLQPLFQQLGIVWRKPKVNGLMVFMFFLGGLSVPLLTLWGFLVGSQAIHDYLWFKEHPFLREQTNTPAALQPPIVESFDKTIVQISKELNARLPMQLNEQTRIDTTLPGFNKLTYVYTILGVSAGEIDENAFTAPLRSSIINSYKTAPGMATLRANGVELDCLYLDESGKQIAEIVVSPKDF